MMNFHGSFAFMALLALPPLASADELFFEAEGFTWAGKGWSACSSPRASRCKALQGAAGAALHEVEIPRAGAWRIWVRHQSRRAQRAPFVLEMRAGERAVASREFDRAFKEGTEDGDFIWDVLDCPLAAGRHTLRVRRLAASGMTTLIDCILITDDATRKPDHVPFGPQTWMRVSLGGGYEQAVQIHIFADHYRKPWYAHYAVSKDGLEEGVNARRKEARLSSGESTGWVNISRMVYQDSGAHLLITPAHRYGKNARRFDGVVEFAPRPDDDAIVRTFKIDYEPSTLHVVVPPDLESPEHIARLRADREFAEEVGSAADAYAWPKVGKAPERFPFFVSANLDPDTMDRRVVERELKTLSGFGFNGIGSHAAFEKHGYRHKTIRGVGWLKKGSYSAPDLERLRAAAASHREFWTEQGVSPGEITCAMVADEPTGEPASLLARDAASIEGFRAWLKRKGLRPADLLVATWEDVRPVPETDRDHFPALHYYTQQYRTVALGEFIALQRRLMKEHWKAEFPVVANFSDGAIYYGNFYGQGVDYFTLLRETEQNAIWGEDWSNAASTYQNATFNVELMRAAARKGGQTIGHHLVVYAGRTPYDIRLKAVSEAARGVKAFESFSYGPSWLTHERTSWQKHPQIWGEHATVVREIGAVEDWLLPAMPRDAEVALLYSSSTDVWTVGREQAYGFERMHTWLALTHAQIPVDVVHERDVEEGRLDRYKVCYLSGPNLTRGAAAKLRDWVDAGGTLVLTAGAGHRDEYDRPLNVLEGMLPHRRMSPRSLQRFLSSGRRLGSLQPQDTVSAGDAKMDVLALKQTFEGVKGGIQGTYADGSPAIVRSPFGKGWVVCQGFLPALDYMRKALVAKLGVATLEKDLEDRGGIPGPEDVLPLSLNEKSYNPWQYPADVREMIVRPARMAQVEPPLRCDVALVDAVYMTCPKGVLVPLANYTLQPIRSLMLDLIVEREIREIRSVHQGKLQFEKRGARAVRVRLPLECTDFLTVEY